MKNKNVSFLVKEVFSDLLGAVEEKSRLSGKVPSSQLSLSSAWRQVLKPSDSVFEPDLTECLGIMSSNLRILQIQLEKSTIIDGEMKQSALKLIEDLTACTKIDQMSSDASLVNRHLNRDKIGHLGWIGISLSQEFPEGSLSKAELDRLYSLLEEAISLLNASDIDPDMKAKLQHHLGFVLWTIENIERVGVEVVYDAIGAVSINTQRAVKRELSKASFSDKSKTALQKVWEVCKEVTAAVEFTDVVIQHGPQLLEGVGHILRLGNS